MVLGLHAASSLATPFCSTVFDGNVQKTIEHWRVIFLIFIWTHELWRTYFFKAKFSNGINWNSINICKNFASTQFISVIKRIIAIDW